MIQRMALLVFCRSEKLFWFERFALYMRRMPLWMRKDEANKPDDEMVLGVWVTPAFLMHIL
jgi:hypothetical protein